MSQDLILILPFVLLLLSIALMPFINEKWWHKNYPYVSAFFGLVIFLFYLFTDKFGEVLISLEEYFSFITLLFSLYVVSGGISFRIKGKATPIKNVALLATGAVIANIFGTTGAAMLLIRPFLNSNEYHFRPYHLVFFIFIVCNVGGSLLPIGDPPLFLGYLKGVPFFWVPENMFIFWILVNAYLLILFYILDKRNYRKARQIIQEEIETKGEEVRLKGIQNFIPLGIIAGAVFITKPLFLREIIMLGAVLLSYKITPKDIYKSNNFKLAPIKEVAVLFIGIFITMIPAIALLTHQAKSIGLSEAGSFFWGCGILTSFLDNAPAYLNFLALAMANHGFNINSSADVLNFVSVDKIFLTAVSVSSVFFGAMTYIGNGPNFMVKSIAEHLIRKAKIPNFIEYMYYSLTILLPFYFLLWVAFF